MSELIGICVFLLLSAFFSGIETGVISVNRLRLRHLEEQGNRAARRIRGFLDRSDRLLATTLIGTNLCNVGASVLAVRLALRIAPVHGEWISTVAITVVVLVLCEMLPKAWFRQAPVRRSLRFSAPLGIAYRVLWPLAKLSEGLTALTDLLLGPPPPTSGLAVTRDELLHLAEESARAGRLGYEEPSMIGAAFEACRTQVGEVMVPAARAVTAGPNDPLDAVRAAARDCAVSRIPVIEPRSRRPLGLVTVYDLIFEPEKHPGTMAREVMRDAHAVRVDETLDHALAKLKSRRQPLAPVVDRRRRFVGLLTIEDILEEVVGEIEAA